MTRPVRGYRIAIAAAHAPSGIQAGARFAAGENGKAWKQAQVELEEELRDFAFEHRADDSAVAQDFNANLDDPHWREIVEAYFPGMTVAVPKGCRQGTHKKSRRHIDGIVSTLGKPIDFDVLPLRRFSDHRGVSHAFHAKRLRIGWLHTSGRYDRPVKWWRQWITKQIRASRKRTHRRDVARHVKQRGVSIITLTEGSGGRAAKVTPKGWGHITAGDSAICWDRRVWKAVGRRRVELAPLHRIASGRRMRAALIVLERRNQPKENA